MTSTYSRTGSSHCFQLHGATETGGNSCSCSVGSVTPRPVDVQSSLVCEPRREVLDQAIFLGSGDAGTPSDHLVHLARPAVQIQPLSFNQPEVVARLAPRLEQRRGRTGVLPRHLL